MRRMICNPLNLEYRYQLKKSPLNTALYREAADPTMVAYKDKYLLFASMGGVIAVSGLRVFGIDDGNLPEKVENVQIRRQGKLNILLSWDAASSAIGYNVRYGIAPEKLYSSWQVFEKTELDIGMVSAGQDYWFAVDSFNENGITSGEVIFAPGKEDQK